VSTPRSVYLQRQNGETERPLPNHQQAGAFTSEPPTIGKSKAPGRRPPAGRCAWSQSRAELECGTAGLAVDAECRCSPLNGFPARRAVASSRPRLGARRLRRGEPRRHPDHGGLQGRRQRQAPRRWHRSAGIVPPPPWRATRQRRRTGPGPRPGVAGLAGDQGRPKPLWNAASKASRTPGRQGLEPRDSAGKRSGVRKNGHQPVKSTGIRATAHRLGHGALAEPLPWALSLLPEKAVGFLGRGFGGER